MKLSKYHSRTCGSVRSSLTALAWGVTSGAKAAVTTSHPQVEAWFTVKWSASLAALAGHRDRLIGMSNVSELSLGVVKVKEPKTLILGSNQNGDAVSCLPPLRKHTDHRTAGILSETKPIVSLYQNKVSPLACPPRAGLSVRKAVKLAGRRGWKKPMPLGNRADKSLSLTRKRADFQLVVNDERVGRTCLKGEVK
jgi:hypothetical protein